jgi:hypothetical protein
MPFEVFSKRSAGKMRQPTITVQKRGTLSVNASAAAFLAGGEIPDEEVPLELLFDRERNILGMRRAQTEHVSVYMLRKQAKSDSFLIAGKAFTAYYGIPTGEARRYVAKDFGEGVLGAELGGEYTDASREESGAGESTPGPAEEEEVPVVVAKPAAKKPAQLKIAPPPKYGGR